eukprot:TCONS_00024536-protein
MEVSVIETKAFDNQKPGTSGLRKPTETFVQENYVENFTQSIFNAVGHSAHGRTVVVGGDGRYFMKESVHTIIKMAAANKIGKLIIGQDGILSTPALSCLIRMRKAIGGIILTASHNPGGIKGDFGIKYNMSNGGPAPEAVTAEIFRHSSEMKEYRICKEVEVDISRIGQKRFRVNGKDFVVQIVDSVDDYLYMMKDIYDFKLLREYIKTQNLRICVNAMNGVTGPYLKKIFEKELETGEGSVINSTPLVDFGGIHPDPNMTYAADFVDMMKKGEYDLGACFDGDGDRNMILGKEAFFVNPSDSVAIIAAHCQCIPYFKKTGIKGFARSMPTGSSLDKVAEKCGVKCHEVPTGWKFFGNLMDADQLSICGEESFGTSSDHIREKDGVWAALAWLSLLANQQNSVQQIVEEHWKTYGRNFFTRYDYENVESKGANELMTNLRQLASDQSLVGQAMSEQYTVQLMDDFRFEDSIDQSVTEKQGIRIIFTDGSRLVFRLSGTGSSGATIRLYIESYCNEDSKLKTPTQEMLKPLVDMALKISNLVLLTGRSEPTVIT